MTSIVDDRDPRITYTGAWFLGGGDPEYDNTTHGTNVSGSSASFNFTGTSISVFGTVGPIDFWHVDVGSSISIYNLDYFPPVTFRAPALNSASYHYQFYTSPPLEDGLHYLAVTSVNMSSVLWLDYFQYTPSSNSSSTSNATTSSTPERTSSATIIATTISGATFLVLLLLGAFWLRHRRKQKRWVHTSQDFLVEGRSLDWSSHRQSQASLVQSPSAPESPSTFRGPLTPVTPQSARRPLPQIPNRQQAFHLVPIAGVNPHEKRDDVSSIAPSQRRISQGGTLYRLHADGGVRVEGGPSGSIDVPPDYREFD
ncbi:hypothetical protein BU15DRAFT_72733 [Melanogaster broomeanus]|nr:hypothetical protein BU15DRAFT_72733 [Melanogaster broomeanus]